MFIVDFDDTLFDTHRFKAARLKAVADVGVSAGLYEKTYQEARNSADGFFTYSDDRHADKLAQQGFDRSTMLAALSTTTGPGQLGQFLFSDTLVFLDWLKKLNRPMILLSLGDPSFQELKVKGSGVHDYFDRLFMVQSSKEDIVRELLEGVGDDPVWFFNDKVTETKRLHETFPRLHPVLRQSDSIKSSEYQESELPHLKTLTEIQAYVEERLA